MASTQTYYMEKDSQFWEIKVADRSTTLRYGKIGRPGRKLAAKEHDTAYKAKQFAIRQVNGKIMQGFQDPNVVVPRAPMVKLLSKRSSVRLQRLQTLQRQKTLKSAIDHIRLRNLSLKKQKTKPASSLKKSDTLLVKKTDPVHTDTGEVGTVRPGPQWRKPPKKQSTIRRQARQVSIVRRSVESKPQKTGTCTAVRSGVKVDRSTDRDISSNISRQDTLSFDVGLTREPSRRQILLNKKNSTAMLPVLDKKRSSWDRPRMSDSDLSMPRLSKESE